MLSEDVARGDAISHQWGSLLWQRQTHVHTYRYPYIALAIPSDTPSDARFPWNKAERGVILLTFITWVTRFGSSKSKWDWEAAPQTSNTSKTVASGGTPRNYVSSLSFHFLPEAGSWERQHAPPALHYGCIMPIPSFQLQKKTCLMQRSRGFGHAVLVTKICYNAVFVLSVVVWEWDCCKPTNTCRDGASSNRAFEGWLPAFQLPMFERCDSLPTRDMLDMFCHSFWDFQASTPYATRSLRLLRAAAHSTSSALCLQKISSLRCSCR